MGTNFYTKQLPYEYLKSTNSTIVTYLAIFNNNKKQKTWRERLPTTPNELYSDKLRYHGYRTAALIISGVKEHFLNFERAYLSEIF